MTTNMTTDLHTAEAGRLLAEAAGLIAANGLHQGDYWPEANGEPFAPGLPCCALGARAVTDGVTSCVVADRALVSDPALLTAIGAVHDVLTASGRIEAAIAAATAVGEWNDENGRSAAEVVTALRRAAAHLANQHNSGLGGSSAKTSHRAGSANHQNDSKETMHV